MTRGWNWATSLVLLAASTLALTGCSEKTESSGAATPASGKPVAAVPAPAGSKWSEVVSETPEGGYRMGNPEAPLKLVEYGSFTCSHCADFAKSGDQPLTEKYVESGKVSFEFRPFLRDPVDVTLAMIARCPGKDVFFALKDQLFGYQADMFKAIQAKGDSAFQGAAQALPEQRFVKVAELAGLIEFAKQRGVPEGQLRACLARPQDAQALAENTAKATDRYSISATPTFLLNGQVLDNTATWPVLEQKLREAGA